jgi:uncharacterized protein (TIGR02284 family)
MQMQQTLIAEKLNHLTAILDDASEGFLTAAQYSRNKDLENLFEKFSYQRSDFARQIKKLVQSMGASSYSKGGFLSLLHRTWKDMCFKLKSRDKEVVKSCCVIGEKFASNYYESLLDDPALPEPVKEVLLSQLSSIHQSLHQLQEVHASVMNASNNLGESAGTNGVAAAEKKVSSLIYYLNEVSKDFEMIADELEDKNLKNAFLALAEEEKQFAQQLRCHVKQYGLNMPEKDLQLQWDITQEDYPESTQGSRYNELLHICDKSEFIFLKLYTDALKELLGFTTLKDIMVYQYNSIRTGFLKLRLLNTLRFSHEYSHV